MKIYLTAGHQVINGKGTGAHGYGDEAVQALKIRDALTAELKNRGIVVLNDPPADALSKVLSWLKTNVVERDIVIDIHFNAARDERANGTEVVIPEKYTKTELALAHDMVEAVAGALGTTKRRGKIIYQGVKTESETQHKRIGILSGPHRAHNILVETCFITNYEEMTNKYPKNFSQLIKRMADVICLYV